MNIFSGVTVGVIKIEVLSNKNRVPCCFRVSWYIDLLIIDAVSVLFKKGKNSILFFYMAVFLFLSDNFFYFFEFHFLDLT